ncbi:PorACj family cell wall channel-forming small protein [Corynebacterium urogenitale]
MGPIEINEIIGQIGDFLGGLSDVFGGLGKALGVVFDWADVKPVEEAAEAAAE